MAKIKEILQLDYYLTYEYASIVQDKINFHLVCSEDWNDFFVELQPADFVKPFQKNTVLHKFSEFIIRRQLTPKLSEINFQLFKKNKFARQFDVNKILSKNKRDTLTFDDWKSRYERNAEITQSSIHSYIEFLKQDYCFNRFRWQLSDEVFFLLFMNRLLLARFNEKVSWEMNKLTIIDSALSEKYLTQKRKLKRVTIPKWVKKAVFFRDRGKCVFCYKDLTNLWNLSAKLNYDHIVPISKGGLNDITNFQLLCDSCNNDKSNKEIVTSIGYEPWF